MIFCQNWTSCVNEYMRLHVTCRVCRVQGVDFRVLVSGLTKKQCGLQHESDDGQTHRVFHKPGIPGMITTWSCSA